MPPCRAHVKASFIIVYSGVAAFEKNLGICDFRPGLPVHFGWWWCGFKVAFYFFWGHGTKLGKNCIEGKGGGGIPIKCFLDWLCFFNISDTYPIVSAKLVLFAEYYFLGAFSRYMLQSFVPNSGTKGFPLLSGLGLSIGPILYFLLENQ